MIKSITIALCLLLLNLLSFGQGSTYYSYDASNGTSQKIGYSVPNKEGSIYSKYTPKVDLDLYTQVGLYKQQRYDANVAKLRDYVSYIYGRINVVYDRNPIAIGAIKAQIDDYCNYLYKTNCDYSNSVIYEDVIKKFGWYMDKVIDAAYN